MMKSTLLRILTLCAGLALGASATLAAEPAMKKVLVFTKSSGFIHDAIKNDGLKGHGYAFRVLDALGAKHHIEFVFSKDGSLFTPEYLAQFDAFFFYTTGDLTVPKSDPRGDGLPPMTAAGKAALLAAVAGGKGFVGSHSASDTFHSFGRNGAVPERFDSDGAQADDYIKMLGGEFIRHGAQQKSHLRVVDAAFPGVSAVPADYAPVEEWYSLKNFAADLHVLRSRSPKHGEELIGWTDAFMASSGLDETADEKRLRHAACLLADIGWRAHPDYRGEQSMNIIAHGNFVAVDHPSRAYLALSVYFRHAGLGEEDLSPRLRELATTRMLDRARVLGAAMRVAYIITAGQGGVLPKTPMRVRRRKLLLTLPGRYSPLGSDRLFSRLRQLARLVGREPMIES